MFLLFVSSGLVLSMFVFVNFAPQFGQIYTGETKQRIIKSPNFKDGKFQNIEKTEVSKNFKYSTIPKFFTNGDKVPNRKLPMKKIHAGFFDNTDGRCKVTWFGHSALMLEMDGKKILLDPMLGKAASPVSWIGSKRFNGELPLDVDSLPCVDVVVLSHDHYDHLDYSTIKKIKNKTDHFIVPLGVGSHLISWGIDKTKITELDWWEETFIEGIKYSCTPSRHFSGRSFFDRDKTLWCSYVIKGESSNIFFGGDSGYSSSFKKIGEQYGPFDLSILECGQYGEQWPEIHMMPEQVAQAHLDLNSKLLLPIHWGAFKLALHPWDEPIKRLTLKTEELNINITTPVIGETIIPGTHEPKSRWWEE